MHRSGEGKRHMGDKNGEDGRWEISQRRGGEHQVPERKKVTEGNHARPAWAPSRGRTTAPPSSPPLGSRNLCDAPPPAPPHTPKSREFGPKLSSGPYLRPGQRGHVQDDVSAQVFTGISNTIGQHQPALGICVVDFHSPGVPQRPQVRGLVRGVLTGTSFGTRVTPLRRPLP